MDNLDEEYYTQRDKFDHTSNVIEKLRSWKEELERKIELAPKDVFSYGLVSEIELAIDRLELLAGTDIKSKRPTLKRLQDTADDYDYRVMCEWGYSDRNKWTDAEENGLKIEVKAGDYIISMK